MLKQEQEEYRQEGIEWQTVEFFNNQVICDLVERPHQGVFAIMDEACLNVGKITDEVLYSFFFLVLRTVTYFHLTCLLYNCVDAVRCYG